LAFLTLKKFFFLKENARHMGVIASDFSLKSQEPLNQKVQTLLSGLQVFFILFSWIFKFF
jgi:hypothetical protein